MHSNAGECRVLVRFSTNLCEANAARNTIFVSLAVAGKSLVELTDLSRTLPRRVEGIMQNRMFTCYLNFISAYIASGGKPKPKFHASLHMWRDDTRFHGNPKHTATWEDESENGVTAKVAAISHPMTFALSVFQRIIAEERGMCSSELADIA